MHLGYFYTIATLLAFSILGVSYKIGERKKCDIGQVNFFLFSTATLLLIIFMLAGGQKFATPKILGFGLSMGAIALWSMAAFRLSVEKGRVSTTWTITSLSLVIPTLGSVLLFGEIPNIKHIIGFVMIFMSILFLGIDIARSGE